MTFASKESVDSLVEAVRSGSSAALVVRGGAPMAWPAEFRVTHIAGAESDADLRWSGLHQLCVQLLDQVEQLTPLQREALRSAFDPNAADPDPSSVGLTLFSLLAGAAETGPVVCLVQRAQWLDASSRQALAFAARRLVSESVALLFIVQGADVPRELTGLSELSAEDGEIIEAVEVAEAVTAG